MTPPLATEIDGLNAVLAATLGADTNGDRSIGLHRHPAASASGTSAQSILAVARITLPGYARGGDHPAKRSSASGAPVEVSSSEKEHVDVVTLVIQSASAHAGNDLELTSIAAVHLGGE